MKNTKNYLFAPFKDDDEKMESFKHFKSYLPKGHVSELIMFIGRLESYYDVIISDLSSKVAVAIADERVIKDLEADLKDAKYYSKEMIKKLQLENKELKDGINALEEQVSDLMIDKDKLKAEIDELQERVKERYSFKYVDGLLAEIRTLKADIKHDAKVCDNYDDDLIKECHELQAENKELYKERERAVNDYEELLNSPNVK